jgi:hypothetical protein
MGLMDKLVRTGYSLLLAGAVTAYAINPPEPPPLVKPKPAPANVSSSEGFPPLPLPATALKRQEKKNPPVPPVLLTKIRTEDAEDWTRTPDDLKGLLAFMSSEMGVNFSSDVRSFAGVTSAQPILYRSGYKPFTLSDAEKSNMRDYILGGGTVVFNALVGHPDFYKSALIAARQVLPEKTLYRLRMDHPVFHSFFDIGKVKFTNRMSRDGVVIDSYPYFDGLDLENRTAVIISRWDLSCGLEGTRWEGWGYLSEDAKKLAANIVCYATAMKDAGKSMGNYVNLVDEDTMNSGKVGIGRVVLNDAPWDTRATALSMILKNLHDSTGTPVSFGARRVRLTDSDLMKMPLIYLSATTDFTLSEAERNNLRRYLHNGGFLFAEASEGRPSFDAAFRREMARVLPGKELKPVEKSSFLYRVPNAISSVKYRPALAVMKGNELVGAPELESIELNGSLAVVYSPRDMSAGWVRGIAPYALGYEAADSSALGVNVLFSSLK